VIGRLWFDRSDDDGGGLGVGLLRWHLITSVRSCRL
jgi:hypothetical protein